MGSASNCPDLANPKPKRSRLKKLRLMGTRLQILRRAKRMVWQREDFQCQCCRRRVFRCVTVMEAQGHVHHWKYRSLGGLDSIDNLILLCLRCHERVHAGELDVKGRTAHTATFRAVPGKKEQEIR